MPSHWLKLGADTATDEKLFGLDVVTRHLWTCLLCAAKKAQLDTGDPTVRGHTAATLAARYNLGRQKDVQEALDLLASPPAAPTKPLIRIDKDGSIFVPNFIKWQGVFDPVAARLEWANRQKKHRGKTKPESHTMSLRVSRRDTEVSHEGVTPKVTDGSQRIEVERKAFRYDGSAQSHEGTADETVDNSVPESSGSEGKQQQQEPVNNAEPAGNIGGSLSEVLENAKAAALRKRGEP